MAKALKSCPKCKNCQIWSLCKGSTTESPHHHLSKYQKTRKVMPTNQEKGWCVIKQNCAAVSKLKSAIMYKNFFCHFENLSNFHKLFETKNFFRWTIIFEITICSIRGCGRERDFLYLASKSSYLLQAIKRFILLSFYLFFEIQSGKQCEQMLKYKGTQI